MKEGKGGREREKERDVQRGRDIERHREKEREREREKEKRKGGGSGRGAKEEGETEKGREVAEGQWNERGWVGEDGQEGKVRIARTKAVEDRGKTGNGSCVFVSFLRKILSRREGRRNKREEPRARRRGGSGTCWNHAGDPSR